MRFLARALINTSSYLGSERPLGQKDLWVRKTFGSERPLGQKDLWVRKTFEVEKRQEE
jgi:hypothetical protein